MHTVLPTSLVIMFAFILQQCTCGYEKGSMGYYEIVSAKHASNVQVIEKFSNYPVENQIDIFLYARNCPNNPHIEPLLIHDGEKKVDHIVARIETEPRVWDRVFLIGVLSRINHNCRCVSGNSTLIGRLEIVDQQMQSEHQPIESLYTYVEMFSDELRMIKESDQ